MTKLNWNRPKRVPAQTSVFRARFSGECPLCGSMYYRGDRIRRRNGTDRYQHADCAKAALRRGA